MLQNRLSRLAAASLLLLSGCGAAHSVGHELLGLGSNNAQPGTTQSVFGYAVADEPQAAIVGRQILNQGGNAADAAAAEGFALAVTLPSRAGLGGGGACLIKMQDANGHAQAPVALLFPAGAPASTSGDRPAAIPTLARGLLALQARYGQLPQSAVIVPAERLAASAEISPALESDLQVVGNALLADPSAQSVFAPGGPLLQTGANLQQPDLAATLEVLRTQGVPGFYAGSFAQNFATAAAQAGGGLSVQDLSTATPQYTAPVTGQAGSYATASLPTAPATGQTLPASAAFSALDKNGGAVLCVTSMNNLFGTGRIAPGTGVLLAASPRTVPVPVLAAALAYTPDSLAFRASATGTGQAGAANAAAQGLAVALGKAQPPVADPGRADIISCPGNVPGGEASCTAAADPRGQGLAIGGR